MEILQFAPVLIVTLNRDVHFKRCVKSLSRCTHADKTDLFIALDYPLNEPHREGFSKINAYVETIQGFKSVNVIKRSENFGALKNFLDARKQILREYDRIIISEDDNEFSPNFLDYINKGLDRYADDSRVSAICGYSFPITIPREYGKNHYFSKAFSAWGYGIWKNRLDSINLDIHKINKFLHNPINAIRLAYIPHGVLHGLMMIVKTGNITGDRIMIYNNFMNNTVSMFPTITQVVNHGHDGSGLHSDIMCDDVFKKQIKDQEPLFEFHEISVEELPMFITAFSTHTKIYSRRTLIRIIKTTIRYILFYIRFYSV